VIKASAGGGGCESLRVAFNDKEAFEGFTSYRNEARAALVMTSIHRKVCWGAILKSIDG
jgi:acetyl/propionyl-CoA carboxylase alpha subunit